MKPTILTLAAAATAALAGVGDSSHERRLIAMLGHDDDGASGHITTGGVSVVKTANGGAGQGCRQG